MNDVLRPVSYKLNLATLLMEYAFTPYKKFMNYHGSGY